MTVCGTSECTGPPYADLGLSHCTTISTVSNVGTDREDNDVAANPIKDAILDPAAKGNVTAVTADGKEFGDVTCIVETNKVASFALKAFEACMCTM